MRSVHVAVFAAVVAVIAVAAGVYLSNTPQDQGGSWLGSLFKDHLDTVEIKSGLGIQRVTHDGKIPLCRDASAAVCVVSGNAVLVNGKKQFLFRVEAPRLNSRCEEERLLADRSAQRLSALLSSGTFTIESATDFGQPGNIVHIRVGRIYVGETMIRERLARRSKRKEPVWCVDDREETEATAPKEKEETWGARFNPPGDTPETGFKAFYFNRDAWLFSQTKSEHTDQIAMAFGRKGPNGIYAGNFAGYWVGRLTFDRSTKQTITVREHGATRIRVNGKTICLTGQQKRQFSHDFGAGNHIVEVEYAKGWHTVEFKVTIGEDQPEVSQRCAA